MSDRQLSPVLKALVGARKLIPTADHWVKERLHQERDGHDAYCIYGAILRVEGIDFTQSYADMQTPTVMAAMKAFADAAYGKPSPWQSAVEFNNVDAGTHARMLDALDKAILNEQAKVPVG